MKIDNYHMLYYTNKLKFVEKTALANSLIPIYAGTEIEIYPHQIAAACFALHSPYSKGVILNDETGLGKTEEALLIVSEKWIERRRKIIIISPVHLIVNWYNNITKVFNLPCILFDTNDKILNETKSDNENNPFLQNKLIITTYEIASQYVENIKNVQFDIVVFEEAHRLRKLYQGNNTSLKLKESFEGVFKVLLTATGMQRNIMDIYGLVNFIDENIFADPDLFYETYYAKPESYYELSERLSYFCFRTLRSQVKKYINIPNRILVTVDFEFTDKESKLNDMLKEYINIPNKKAFPKMSEYYLTLMLLKQFSSSSYALCSTLEKVSRRLENIKNSDIELEYIKNMIALCKEINEESKGKALLKALKTGFSKLKKVKAQRKALIFTESKITQGYINKLLTEKDYKTILYNGDFTRDYSIAEKFKNEVEILISTDLGAEGFDFPFCSFVINYDMTWNILNIEQRIGRCHRIYQQHDIIVVNFLNKKNFADVRLMELINKRLLAFEEIFGISDYVVDNFEHKIEEIISRCRTKKEIDEQFNKLQKEYYKEINKNREKSHDILFAAFDENVIEKIKYDGTKFQNDITEYNNMLWEITKAYLQDKAEFSEDGTKSFYFNNNIYVRNYVIRSGLYSMENCSNNEIKYNINNSLAEYIIDSVYENRYTSGVINFDGSNALFKGMKGIMGFYAVKLLNKKDMEIMTAFVGITDGGKEIYDSVCEEIFNLPVIDYKEGEKKIGYKYKAETEYVSDEEKEILNGLFEKYKIKLSESLVKRYDEWKAEEIRKINYYYNDHKRMLERNIDKLKNKRVVLRNSVNNATNSIQKMEFKKSLVVLNKELKKKENELYLDTLKLENEREEKIKDCLNDTENKTHLFIKPFEQNLFFIRFTVV